MSTESSELFFGFEWPSYQYEDEGNPRVTLYLDELEELGFERLGVKWEAPPGWERMRSIELSSAGHECFASCAINNGNASVHLLTSFVDGTVVVSWFGSINEEIRTDRFVHRNARGQRVVELLETHAAEVARQKAAGKEVVHDFTAEGRLQASCHYYANPDNPLALYQLRLHGQRLSMVFDVVLAMAWLLVLMQPLGTWVSFSLILAASAAMAASHWVGTRGTNKKMAWVATAVAALSVAWAAWDFRL
jgi:hypothetical protein